MLTSRVRGWSLGHLAAVLLLGRLVAALSGCERTAFGAAFLFAVFPGANNLFADPIHFERTWNLALALAAVLAFGDRCITAEQHIAVQIEAAQGGVLEPDNRREATRLVVSIG